ncbi:macrolide family glycosyltransferase [Kutzneria buriramensis]|uniref:MGT family glycosyltransferase n=1 Tax=Kutzneria buriramensis TaxID=1045776 RepID=A0A3E0GZD0_9PSEU|nr:macrolide family glycosyltransferase [Kutzneria buriramensis]REH35704.1 MGT family glycosyltransferase [Kutzneria buriramensis]
MHIAFATGMTTSHVGPMLGIVAELRRRGHRVSYAVTDAFADRVAAAGARPVGYRSRLPRDPRAWPKDFFGLPLLLLDEAIATLPELAAAFATDRPDVVVSEDPASALRLLATRWDIPQVQVWSFLASRTHWTARYGHGHQDVSRLLTTLTEFLRRQGIDRTAEQHYAAGFDGGIVLLPRSYQPAGHEFGAGYSFVGPCLADPPAARARADGRRPLLLVSLGSINTAHPEFYRTCADAFADLDWEVVMSVGSRTDAAALGPLPRNVTALPWVPQMELLSTARAFVTHAGMNSLMEALYLRVPVVAVPRLPEQVTNARRLVELGLGRALSVRRATAEALRSAVLAVAEDAATRERLAAMGAEMRASGGAAAAADHVEAAAG